MISLISRNDWANVGYEYGEALKSIGIDAEAYALKPHALGYANQAKRIKNERALDEILSKTDILIHMHSKLCELPLGKTFASYRIQKHYVFHGGSAYRHHAEEVNNIFNPLVEGTIIQTRGLWSLGAKNKHWILPPIDTAKLKPDHYEPRIPGKLVFAHYPSWDNKGTIKYINPVMEKMKQMFGDRIEYRFGHWENRVSHTDNMNRIMDCDVYIEAIHEPDPTRGEWGMAGLESACMGKIVLTNFKSLPYYKEEYGNCALHVTNSPDELENEIIDLVKMDYYELKNQKIMSRLWVEELHSYRSIGEKLAITLGL